MKSLFKLPELLFVATLFTLLFTTNACSNEQVRPDPDGPRITVRTPDCGIDVSEQVKVKVSERDHIPLSEVLTSNYYGATTEGYCEYRLTTLYNGPKVYIVTAIIEDDIEGF